MCLACGKIHPIIMSDFDMLDVNININKRLRITVNKRFLTPGVHVHACTLYSDSAHMYTDSVMTVHCEEQNTLCILKYSIVRDAVQSLNIY